MIPLAIKQTTGCTQKEIDRLKWQAFSDYCYYTSKGNHLLLQLMLTDKALFNWAMIQIENGEKKYYSAIVTRSELMKKSAARQIYINSIRAFIYAQNYNRRIMSHLQQKAVKILRHRVSENSYTSIEQTFLN